MSPIDFTTALQMLVVYCDSNLAPSIMVEYNALIDLCSVEGFSMRVSGLSFNFQKS